MVFSPSTRWRSSYFLLDPSLTTNSLSIKRFVLQRFLCYSVCKFKMFYLPHNVTANTPPSISILISLSDLFQQLIILKNVIQFNLLSYTTFLIKFQTFSTQYSIHAHFIFFSPQINIFSTQLFTDWLNL